MFANQTLNGIWEEGPERLKVNLRIRNKDKGALSRSNMLTSKERFHFWLPSTACYSKWEAQTNRWQFRNVLYRVSTKPEQLLPSGTLPPECCENSTRDGEMGGQQYERQKLVISFLLFLLGELFFQPGRELGPLLLSPPPLSTSHNTCDGRGSIVTSSIPTIAFIKCLLRTSSSDLRNKSIIIPKLQMRRLRPRDVKWPA